jgi:hypothetical protein
MVEDTSLCFNALKGLPGGHQHHHQQQQQPGISSGRGRGRASSSSWAVWVDVHPAGLCSTHPQPGCMLPTALLQGPTSNGSWTSWAMTA